MLWIKPRKPSNDVFVLVGITYLLPAHDQLVQDHFDPDGGLSEPHHFQDL